MRLDIGSAAWWGPPRKFDRPLEERKVSWLELFFDLVYVIAIARITQHFFLHINIDGFIEYVLMFMLIYWGWLNGSLYHDLHGNEGLRTRLMTLWQMMIIAAFAITIDQPDDKRYFHITVVSMVMQLYITYLWWSVGFYDKSHRRYNKPYTILYLISLGIMGLCLVVSASWLPLLLPTLLICNYAPPFISFILLRRSSLDLDLTSSMVERLGLLAIIVFGEVVLGVVNGISKTQLLDVYNGFNFAFSLSIVFVLWWIFFTLISNMQVKKGFNNATLFELLYIPALMSLGFLAVSFTALFNPHQDFLVIRKIFGLGISIYLVTISLMLGLSQLPDILVPLIRPVRISLLLTASVFLISIMIRIRVDVVFYLAGTLFLLLSENIYLNLLYYRYMARLNDKTASIE